MQNLHSSASFMIKLSLELVFKALLKSRHLIFVDSVISEYLLPVHRRLPPFSFSFFPFPFFSFYTLLYSSLQYSVISCLPLPPFCHLLPCTPVSLFQFGASSFIIKFSAQSCVESNSNSVRYPKMIFF